MNDSRCYCGSKNLRPGPHKSYLVCAECHSAILRDSIFPVDLKSPKKDESHLYGKDYWEAHQVSMGLQTIEHRSRSDIADRCQYWLRFLLKYSMPPSRVLELGCSHGGFLKLLNLAGYNASGVEMSCHIIEESQQRFGVSIRQGPLESASQTSELYNAIVLFDVLEHVPDPLATIETIAEHLTGDGIVVIQTPRHDEFAEATWPMYLAPEHTFLYSTEGLQRLLRSKGLNYIAIEPSKYSYDQFVFSSRQPLRTNTNAEIAERLLSTPDGRMALAMQDMYSEIETLRRTDPAVRYGTRSLAAALVRASYDSVARRLGFGRH